MSASDLLLSKNYGAPEPAERLCVLLFALVVVELVAEYCVVVRTSTPLPCSRIDAETIFVSVRITVMYGLSLAIV